MFQFFQLLIIKKTSASAPLILSQKIMKIYGKSLNISELAKDCKKLLSGTVILTPILILFSKNGFQIDR